MSKLPSRFSKAAFERSAYDNDRGVKEGSKADLARDKKQMARMKSDIARKNKARGK